MKHPEKTSPPSFTPHPGLASIPCLSYPLDLDLASTNFGGLWRIEVGQRGTDACHFLSFHERTVEIKRQRRRATTSVSVVSTSELLKSDGDCSVKKAIQEIMMAVIEKEKKQMKREILKREEREEFPGSPSFRVYCEEVPATSEPDNDQIKVIEKIKEEKLAQEKESIQAEERKGRENSGNLLISKEDSVRKPQKKEKGRRFWALMKASSRVYIFLSVKNCYSPNNTTGTAPDDCPRPRHHSVKST